MRITYEVVKSIDPDAWVAPGGLGYTSFLDAMLRYTDNPKDGSVTCKYPHKGGAYFDCLSYHQYAKYGVTDERTGIGYHKGGSDNLAMKYVTLKNNMEYRLEKYGFDCKTYPRKMFICTESGLSDIREGNIGGEIARRNYILKQQLYAREYGIKQSHWFVIADGGNDGGMGDYPTIIGKTLDTAQLKDSSKGRLVWKNYQLGKMAFNVKKTQKLRKMLSEIDGGVNNFTGMVFTRSNRTWPYSPNDTLGEQPKAIYALWRRCDEYDEVTEKKTITLTVDGSKGESTTVIFYDGRTQTYGSSVSSVSVSVDGTPVFVIPAGEDDINYEDIEQCVSNESASEEECIEAAPSNKVAFSAVLLLTILSLLLVM